MIQALLSGVASIKSQQSKMNVIGNNLANVNTTSYKGTRVTFEDMIAQTIRAASRPSVGKGGTNPYQLGLGTTISGTDSNNEQGALSATNRPTDIAIQGNGYFLIGDGYRVAYTRDGSFDIDSQGRMVHRASGERLLGYNAATDGSIDTSASVTAESALTVPIGSLTATQATTSMEFQGTLLSSASPVIPGVTTVRVYDQLGAPHDLTMRFDNRSVPPAGTPPPGAMASWEWSVSEGATVVGSSASPGNELLYFDAVGALVNASSNGTVIVPGSSGTTPMTISASFGKIAQQAGDTSFVSAAQDGFPPGSLQGFGISVDGLVTGNYTNGLTRNLGQVAVAIFSNPGGLERLGSNTWRSTENSGTALHGVSGTGGRGSINAGFLEQSNVDISSEFTDLIVTQRGFQANTRVVTTVDEMLQELLNMKR